MKLHGLAKHPASVYGVYIYYIILYDSSAPVRI